MNEREFARALEQIAKRDVPDTLDHWPAIRSRIAPVPVALPRRTPRRRLPWRWRAAGALVVAAALIGALLVTATLWPSREQTANAQEILTRAQAAAGAGGNQISSYHLQATTRRFGPNPIDFGVFPARTVETEQWQAGSRRWRIVDEYKDDEGAVTLSRGDISNGSEMWMYFAYDNLTDVMWWPPEWKAPQSLPPLPERAAPTSLTELLDQLSAFSAAGCGTAQLASEATVAQRAVYVVVVVATGDCGKGPEVEQQPIKAGQRLTLRIDKQTFLTLGWERSGADGTLLASYTVSSIDYGETLPDSQFAYTPPADALVCAAGSAYSVPPCQTKGPQRKAAPAGGKDGQPLTPADAQKKAGATDAGIMSPAQPQTAEAQKRATASGAAAPDR